MINEEINQNFAEFKKIMQGELKENFEKYLKALNEKPVRGLRINTKKISVKDFLAKTDLTLTPLKFSNDCFILNSDEKLGGSVGHLAGLIYLQEPSSMIAVASSGIEKENRPLKVLDLCASPGGKTGQIVTKLTDESLIFSNEIIGSRAGILFSNVERQGFKNVIVLNEEPKNLLDFEGFFDYVFIDAPCSGEGMFRKNPETINEWSEKNVVLCANRQREILKIADKLLSDNGKLVYSTCTFSKQEDEEIVEFLVNNLNYKLEDVPSEIKNLTLPSLANVKNADFARKFYPFTGEGEGQFVAVFSKNEYENACSMHKKKHFNCLNKIGGSHFKLLCEFMEKNLNVSYSKNQVFELGETLFLAPSSFDEKMQTALDDKKILTIGVKLGNIEKDRFEPNHSIFMANYDDFKHKVEISDEDLKKYLHGEELKMDLNFNGYAVVTKNGLAIGGVKVTAGKLKNLYPRGLRI